MKTVKAVVFYTLIALAVAFEVYILSLLMVPPQPAEVETGSAPVEVRR